MPVPDGTSSTSSWREVCPSPTPARLTRPLLAAVQEPSGAPESLATGPLAHQPAHTRAGWVALATGMGQWGSGASPRPRSPNPLRIAPSASDVSVSLNIYFYVLI
jgi:hypothetical protein